MALAKTAASMLRMAAASAWRKQWRAALAGGVAALSGQRENRNQRQTRRHLAAKMAAPA